MSNCTIIEYQYCDAGNYKVSSSIRLQGVFKEEEIDMIQSSLYDAEYFIPEKVGMPPLQSLLWSEFGGCTEDDHQWHSIIEIRSATINDFTTPLHSTTSDLLAAFLNMQS